jgi:VanZ family protein
MKSIIRHYPITLVLTILIIYLSCFKPPHNSLEDIAYMDKIVHLGMYLCLSLMAWFEFFHVHKTKEGYIWWEGWIMGFLFPGLLGILMEIIQKYCTTYRAFEWGDIIADLLGILFAAVIAEVYIRKHY